MAEVSLMLALGTPLPHATLPDVRSGDKVTLSEMEGRALVVIFMCNHCPYVKRIADGLAKFSTDYDRPEVAVVGIASNDVDAYPEDSPAELARLADAIGYRFPILYDEDQTVARSFSAVCTPDFFVFGPERTLVYRGQFDGARPANDLTVTGEDLRTAVDAVIAGDPVPTDQRPSMGCSIKWKTR